MASRRGRRNVRGLTLLPLRTRHLSNSLSCWYCDFKTSVFNELLFYLGRRHARFLRVWFAIGVGFSFVALVGVTLMLLWESTGSFQLYSETFGLGSLSLSWLFGTSPLLPGFSLSLMDTAVMVFSTLISVAIHEFGHAIAAASEGVQIEYLAIFLAIVFPGALVAFNYDLLQNLPHFAALRIYCAGIWHNLVSCAVCGLIFSFLPSILYPLYIHGEGPMVLKVSQKSPLSGYLSPGDVIVSVDGLNVHNPHEWIKKMAQVNIRMLQNSYHFKDSQSSRAVGGRKGYCVPNSWIEVSKNIQTVDDQFCPDELAAFVSMPCFNSSLLIGNSSEGGDRNREENKHCLTAMDIVKLNKCGNGWQMTGTDKGNCTCSEEESCMTPVLKPGTSWVEISYSSPYSSECLQQRKNSSTDSESPGSRSTPCGGTFVFVGDVLSVAYSVQLSAYRPHWAFIIFSAHIPVLLEKILACTFHVSLTLGFLNSLPVFFLDGESILETGFCYITWLSPSMRRKVLRVCLFGGTLLSAIAFSRILYSIFIIRN